jgi:site-specific DNA-methyltransferase (adenine-specific)
MHTSFFRFMMLLAKNGHNLTNNVYRYVPVVDLSKKWTDAALFKRYGIIKSEQDFIKSVIKDIND